MIIYQARNKVNNKIYIGMTKNNLSSPIGRHKSRSNNGSDTYFCNAIRKYGWENFEWTILDSSAKTIEELKQLEIDYIAKLKPEYNMTAGGDGLSNPSEKTRLKMSLAKIGKGDWNKGLIRSQKTKDKISKSLLGHSYNKGHIVSETTKDRISEANRGKIPHNKGKKGLFSHNEDRRRKISEASKKYWRKRKGLE